MHRDDQKVVAGFLLVCALVLGDGPLGEASESPLPLQFQKNRVSGFLTQVPLRKVLEYFRVKLGMEYVMPKEETEKPVSAKFENESIPNVLSKILATWDYALEVDQHGKVRQVFVVSKTEAQEIEDYSGQTSEVPNLVIAEQPIKTAQMQIVSPEYRPLSHSARDGIVFPMLTDASGEMRPMPIRSPQGGAMRIQPSSSVMTIRPAVESSPPGVSLGSENAQMEFTLY